MDENKEKSNISLPTGCMISKTSFVADTKNDEKEEKKKVKGKNNKDTKKKTIFFVIVAVIVASVFGVMDYLKSNKKSDKNGNSTIISTSQGTQTPNDATKSDGEENIEDIKQNVDVSAYGQAITELAQANPDNAFYASLLEQYNTDNQ
mgnify:CR=1 FL=1